ncbi:hypothetical protein K8353_10470 [Burkholderia contaminans]|nr:hypothetical protein [Burkholderia contaminans]
MHRPGFRQPTSSSYRRGAAIDIATTNSIQPTNREDEQQTGWPVVNQDTAGPCRGLARPTSVAVLEKRRVIHPVVARTGFRPRPVRIAAPVAGPRRRLNALRAVLMHNPACAVPRDDISFVAASHCITSGLKKLSVPRPSPSDTRKIPAGPDGAAYVAGSITQKAGHIERRMDGPGSRGDRSTPGFKTVQF